MYKKIRKSLADVIANVDNPEQFEWKKWLNQPQIYLEKFPKPSVSIQSINSYQAFPSTSLYQVKNFALTKIKVSSAIKNVTVQKRKTFKIFFLFNKPYQRQIKVLNSKFAKIDFILSFFYKDKELFLRTGEKNDETIVSLIPENFAKNIEEFSVITTSENLELKKAKFLKSNKFKLKSKLPIKNIDLPSAESPKDTSNIQLPDFKKTNDSSIVFGKVDETPKIFNIQVLGEEKIKEELLKSEKKHVLSFPVNPLPDKTKQQQVDFSFINKIQVPLYHLKNFKTQETKLEPNRLMLLRAGEIHKRNIYLDPKVKTIISNPGILNLLNIKDHQDSKERKVQEKTIERTEPVEIKPAEITKPEEETITVNWENIENSFKPLLKYQREGMHFLLTNKKALLSGELGTELRTQAVCALAAAVKTGTIKNAVIVCTPHNIGNKKVAEEISNLEGWENLISKWGPDLNVSIINSELENNKPTPSEGSQIYITTYDVLLGEDGEQVKNKIFSDVDCLILDEAQKIIIDEVDPEKIFHLPKSKYVWIISSYNSRILEERLIPILTNHLSGFEKLDNSLSRSKFDLKNELCEITRHDYWLELDKDQQQEFDNIITQGKKRIFNLVESGNPFILQSNIFTLIHQIKQIENFSTHNDNSPKANLLLEHLESILTNGQKTIIFSQYDRQGIQKIERLLKSNDIRYVLYQSGMPLKDLESSINKFKKEPKTNVMIAGLTAATIKMKLAEAPYFIHFDQWWNPINQWQYEDKTVGQHDSKQQSNHLSVINYYTDNPVEINIRKTLQKKGLLNKNLIDSLSNEIIYNLVSNEDWLDILGIEYPKTRKNRINDVENIFNDLSEIKYDNLGQKVKTLYTKLGFKNLVVKSDSLNNISLILGIINKGINDIKSYILCLPFSTKDPKVAETFVKESLKSNTRLFIICSRELIQNTENINDENVSWIDQETLAQYLSIFKVG